MGSVLNQQHASKVSFCTVMCEWKYEVKWKIARVYRTVEVDVIRRTVWHPLPPPLLTLSILNIFCRRKEGLNHLIAFKYFLLSRLPHPHSLGSQAVFYPLFPWTVWQIQTNWLFFFFVLFYSGGASKGGGEEPGKLPEQAEEESQVLHGTGHCKWFNVRMGFGFISMINREGSPLDIPVDVFVHQVS